jgi:hypothetical protein
MSLLEYEDATKWQLEASSGYVISKYQRALDLLVSLEWVRKPWNGRWGITERGKIALAIEVGRRTKQRGRASFRPIKMKAFMDHGTEASQAG